MTKLLCLMLLLTSSLPALAGPPEAFQMEMLRAATDAYHQRWREFLYLNEVQSVTFTRPVDGSAQVIFHGRKCEVRVNLSYVQDDLAGGVAQMTAGTIENGCHTQ